MSIVDEAEEAYRVAAYDYEMATTRYEAAIMRRDEAEKRRLRPEFAAAGEKLAKARADLVAAHRRSAPTFEDILRDPTQQMDRNSEVMRSIIAYQNAPSSTAGERVKTVGTVWLNGGNESGDDR